MTIILGIDPGLQHTGWGIIKQNGSALSYVASGVIHTKSSESVALRIKKIHLSLTEVINLYKPTESALEETFVNMNSQSSLKLAHARGAIMLSLSIHNLPVFEYSTRLIKKTVTGSGKADKIQIKQMISLLLPGIQIANEDEADAVATAICHSAFVGNQLKVV